MTFEKQCCQFLAELSSQSGGKIRLQRKNPANFANFDWKALCLRKKNVCVFIQRTSGGNIVEKARRITLLVHGCGCVSADRTWTVGEGCNCVTDNVTVKLAS
jgi:hypothetical protein